MAKALLEWETIDADQIDDIMAGKPPRPPKPTQSSPTGTPPPGTAPQAGPGTVGQPGVDASARWRERGVQRCTPFS